ncbi:MAG: tRNA (adenosine(37)-N6)-threonylcarbamoyltransferase complex ATPase subunit type 1 TsaE [Balneolaceae bacterium]
MLSSSVEQTIAFGKEFAKELSAGDVVCLDGDLGAGKTHFVKGIASFFGLNEDQVSSPTFTLINEYQGIIPIFHFDCYRLESEQEALEIGTEEYFYNDGISIVEWPQKIKTLIPKNAVWITIKHAGNNHREIIKK